MHGEDLLWEVYVEALLKRFSSTYEDPITDMKNISQKGGYVQVYIDDFNVLMIKEVVFFRKQLTQCLDMRIVQLKIGYGNQDAIDAMVKELLKSGVIRASHGPFPSLIVMVKKKDGSWRMCVDYKALNNKNVKEKFPIPVIEKLIDELFGAQVFTKLDLRSMTEHTQHLAQVLGTMQFQKLYAKMSKCVFGSPQVEYLRHVIYEKGIATDPSKLAQKDFDELKNAMVNTPVLALLNFQEEFTVETNASDEGIRAVLLQKGHPIAYLSRALAPMHKGLSTYEKELRLKPFKGQPANVIPLPHCTTSGVISVVPVAVIDRKIAKVKNAVVVYWLVQWSNGSQDDAT
uniref:Reverse transcriptase/retrotransposon-derived protein RNase H-like domain-containing protein n=1 Tax=Tanacetum cinerariifolium TaxID=118510 RepID=A0A6L2KCE6_TANCI|nr:hypothetical protein [Tanacetum cinerariifolium]